eukprot:SAG31_NODE_4763_length_2973_cov_1.655532_4_plen_114_part_00
MRQSRETDEAGIITELVVSTVAPDLERPIGRIPYVLNPLIYVLLVSALAFQMVAKLLRVLHYERSLFLDTVGLHDIHFLQGDAPPRGGVLHVAGCQLQERTSACCCQRETADE